LHPDILRFPDRFCNPRNGNEKRLVQNIVCYNFVIPVPEVSLSEREGLAELIE